MFRKTVFWIHLGSGLVAGLVILTMSFTGLVLTYERQINRWLAEAHFVAEADQQNRLSIEQLQQIQLQQYPDIAASSLLIDHDSGAPVQFRAGRRGGVSLNPYTGEEMETGSEKVESFFRSMTSFHRWFSIEGENRAIARQVTGVSNLAFLFLTISGLYLWFPSIFKWTLFKARLLFRGSYPNSKSRDFHWHHIFGIWMAIPLIPIIYTGSMFNYQWATQLVYSIAGVEAPNRARAPVAENLEAQNTIQADDNYLTLDALLNQVIAETDRPWQRINLTLPKENDSEVQVELDWGNGAQAHKRHTLLLDRSSGDTVSKQTYEELPASTRIGGFRRFLHTGEIWGFWGQTLAGLASLAALFMVWTGVALSYRRLIQPLFKKKA